MSNFKPRHGLSKLDVERLYGRWKVLRKDGHDFESFDAFVKWSGENGCEYHARLKKIDENRPFGPDNAYWKPAERKKSNGKTTGAGEVPEHMTESPCVKCRLDGAC